MKTSLGTRMAIVYLWCILCSQEVTGFMGMPCGFQPQTLPRGQWREVSGSQPHKVPLWQEHRPCQSNSGCCFRTFVTMEIGSCFLVVHEDHVFSVI